MKSAGQKLLFDIISQKEVWVWGEVSNAIIRAVNESAACPIWWQRVMSVFPSDHMYIPRGIFSSVSFGGVLLKR